MPDAATLMTNIPSIRFSGNPDDRDYRQGGPPSSPNGHSPNGQLQANGISYPLRQPAQPSDALPESLAPPPTPVAASHGIPGDWLTQAEQHLAQQQWPQAIAAAQQAAKLTPNALAYKLMGNAYQALGQIPAAQQAYGQALRLQPQFPEVYANLGSLYAQQQQWPRAIAAYRQALQQQPRFAGAYRNLAKIFTQVGRTAAALECQYRAFRLEPQPWEVGAVLNLGNRLLEANKLEAAIACYRHVIQLKPELAGVYQNLAEAFRRQGDLQAAIGYSQKAVALLAQQGVTQAAYSPSQALPPTPVKPANSPLPQSPLNDSAQPLVSIATQDTAMAERLQLVAAGYCQRREWGKAIAACREALRLRPHAPTYKYLGDALQATGQLGAAAQAYQEALRLDPQFAAGYANLGSLLAQQQQWQRAIAAFRQALAINPQFAGVYRNLARLWEKLGDEERALACWQRALMIEPASLTAVEYVTLGNRWVKLNKLLEAGRCYQRAINFDPSLVGAWYNLAEICSMQARWDDAILAYRRAIALKSDQVEFYQGIAKAFSQRELWREAEYAYRRALALAPESDELHHRRADVLVKLQQWELAVMAYQRAIALNPKHFWAHNNLGDVLMRLERWEEAISCYQQATQLNPEWVWAFYNLGDALAQCQRWEETVIAYRQAIALKADLPGIALKLARAYRSRARGDLEQAATWYAQALQEEPMQVESCEAFFTVRPQTVQPYFPLGAALVKHDRAEEAIALYQALRSAVAEDTEAAEVEFELGKALAATGQVDQAQAAYETAIRLDPEHHWAHHYLAETLATRGQLAAAIEHYNQAIAASPSPSFWSYYNRAKAQAEQGKTEEAIESYRQAIAINPNYSWAHKHLGDLLATHGDVATASTCYRRAIQCKPKIF